MLCRTLVEISLVACVAVSFFSKTHAQEIQPVEQAQPAEQERLTRVHADTRAQQVWEQQIAALRPQLQAELDQNEIKAGDKAMKLLVKQFGAAPSSGAALYISMHGGGSAPWFVNDQQWENQIHLYEPEEGYYVAPRAPTNSWNLWHEAHIDDLFDRLILAFVVCKNVDPNRVYLMGYSAGGDGVFQLAPRMADRFAAVAVMAGHPNETRADGLRNLPFALFMGGDDAAYDRNKLAGQWRDELQRLSQEDPNGYEHWVQIYPNTGHWMDSKDREVLPWFQKFSRQAWPKKVVWLQGDRTHTRLYWLGVDAAQAKKGAKLVGEISGQEIRLESELRAVRLFLNDKLLDLDQPIRIFINEQLVFDGMAARSEAAISRSLSERLDRELTATAIVDVVQP